MSRGKIQAGLLAGAWGIFALVAVWRAALAGSLVFQPNLVAVLKAVLHGQRLDEFVPWMVVAILLLSGPRGIGATTLRERRIGWLLTGLLAAGVLLTALGIGADEGGWFDGWPASMAGLGVMAACTLLVSMREIKAILRALRAQGVTILDLWRFATAQWGLLMVAATLCLWLRAGRGNLLGDPGIGRMLFVVPAAGALPSALMAAGIAWWDRVVAASGESAAGVDLRPAARPRVRAWVLAFVCNTAGGLLLVLPTPLAAVPGAGLEIVAVALYLAGFPRIFWRGAGGKIVLVAWGLLLLALAAMTVEGIFSARAQTIVIYYQLAWRQVWTTAVLLCLVGLGTRALECLMAPRWVAATCRVIVIAAVLVAAGAAVTTTLLLTAATQSGAAQVGVMQWLIAGAVPTALGVAGLGVALLRSIRSA